MSKPAKIVGGILGTLGVVASLTVVVFCYTSWGNEQIRQSIVSNASRGDIKVEIDRVGDFKLFSPFGAVWATVEGLRVIGPDDTELVAVGEFTAALDITALLSRTVHLREVNLQGVEIPVDRETGYPRVGTSGARRKAFEPRAMDVQFDNVSLGLYLVGASENGKTILGRLHGELEGAVPSEEPGVRMTIKKAKGMISRPQSIELLSAYGTVDTSAEKVADIDFSAVTQGAAITGSIAYVPSDPEHPIQPNIENVRDAGMLNNPMETLNGMGLPMDALKTFMPQAR